MNAPNIALSGQPTLSLEAVELELALTNQDPLLDGFETALLKALKLVGGHLLFHVRVDNSPGRQRVAAVSVGEGPDRQVLLVVLPTHGGPMSVEAPDVADDPFAGLAASYAGLLDCLSRP